jgi:type II secretory ATPase GspE/PulE/Tfp pilus assembly ATPase PilB-like protein
MLILPEKQLKEILMRAGVIDEKSFDMVRVEAERKGQNIAEILVSEGVLTRDYLYLLLAKTLGLERVNLANIEINEDLLKKIPEDVARQKKSIIFGKEESTGSYLVAMEDPTDLEIIDFLKRRLNGFVKPYLATEDDLNRGYLLYNKQLTQDFKKVIEESVQETLRLKARGALKEVGEDLPVVAIVDNLLSYAISSRSTDVHIEALEDSVYVRFRIDGVLHEIINMPREIRPAIVARIKILSGLRVDEHTHPQDGRFRHQIGDEFIDIRVSVIPTFYGEKVEMRLLTSAEKPISFQSLGMFDDTIKMIQEGIKKTYGMVVVCGPTGSGKTTTLYSILNVLNRPEVNIVTIEDPIEYDMRYINQTQVNPAAGVTFSSGLRSILRQDPNIILVGEIRDNETADIAIQAALTGHLVLSSLHTNDAPTAIPRLFDMGIPPFLVSAVLNIIAAQRLARRIHKDCIESYTPDAEIRESLEHDLLKLSRAGRAMKIPKVFYRGKGCPGCGGTGFLGRLTVCETMLVTERIRKMIISGKFDLDEVRDVAREEGMLTMVEDGLRKVELGLTTIEEIFRIIRE